MLSFAVACGHCWFCERGETNLCEHAAVFGAGPFGGNLQGTQAEMVRVPWADVNLLAVPAGVDDDRAVFVGDVLTTGFHAASLAGARPDDVVAVFGAGPVGWCAASSLRALGVERVFLLDREPTRLALALKRARCRCTSGSRARRAPWRRPRMTAAPTWRSTRWAAVDAYVAATTLVRRGGRVVVAGVYAGESVELQLGVAWARALDIRFTGVCPVHRQLATR